jgi:Rv0078B-related antitoxin
MSHGCHYNGGIMEMQPAKWRLDQGQIEIVDEAVAAVLRQKTPAERIALASAANRTARALFAAQIRRQHADWTDAQVDAEVARRLTGE